jgi:uncharacterized protein YrrD
MQRLYSEIVGSPVVSEFSESRIAKVADVILDPDRGKIIALEVTNGMVIAAIDIVKLNSMVVVHDPDHITHPSEILRVQEVIEGGRSFMKKKVVTEDGELVGYVQDYAIDTKTFMLKKINTYKQFFVFRHDPRIIGWKSIIEVKKDEIVVKGSVKRVKVKEEAVVVELMPA